MDKEFLLEYQARELEENKRITSIVDRIGELKSPVFNLSQPCETLWGQIPFSGTIIFPLRPLPERDFENSLNISVQEIPDLIKFANETNKIKFLLCDYPINFQRYDYLEPFFEEVNPPLYMLSEDDYVDTLKECYRQSEIEITTLFEASSKMRYLNYISGGEHIVKDYIIQYAWLRYFGLNDFADQFRDNALLFPDFSTFYLETAYNLLVHPILDPFHASYAYSIDTFNRMKEIGFGEQENGCNLYFSEVGSVLLKKITYYPESLTACKDVISRYEGNDLYNVYSALHNGIKDKNPAVIIEKRDELTTIIDNVWQDAQIVTSNQKMYRYGISAAVGIIGCSFTTLLGVIGTLGLEIFSEQKDQIAELIARQTAFPYLTTIYDFKKKYAIQ